MPKPKESIMHFYLSECPVKTDEGFKEQRDLINILTHWDQSKEDNHCSCEFAMINSAACGIGVEGVKDKNYVCHMAVSYCPASPEVIHLLKNYYETKGILVRASAEN